MDPKTLHKGGLLRWAVNTSTWNPTRTEWVFAMKLVGNDEERTRINRFVYKKDAKHALIGRLLILKCCDHFLGPGRLGFTPNSPLILKRSEKGKPILFEVDSSGRHVPYNQFQFNISHSGDFCVLAADSRTTKLGIDIMKVEYSGGMHRLPDFFRIMRKQYSEDEWKYIQVPQTDYGRLARFIRLWSLKESFVKAEGSGIAFPLSKISFQCPTELTSPSQKIFCNSTIEINEQRQDQWLFEESMIDHRHYVSVAMFHNSDIDKCGVPFQMLTIKDLIENEDRIRLQIELEFVQCLGNPNYLNFLAQRGYFNEKSFINYLDYLQYWKRPEYAKFIKYPMCLHFLDLLQHDNFRRELSSVNCAKFIDDQIILHWQHYARKRTKLFQSVQQKQQQTTGTQTPGSQQAANTPATSAAPNSHAPLNPIVNGHASLK